MNRYGRLAFLLLFLLSFWIRSEVRPNGARLHPLPAVPGTVEEAEAPDRETSAAFTPKAEGEASPAVPEPAIPDPPRKRGVLAGLRWLARHQNDDGSWGDVAATLGGHAIGRTAVTSLAILAFLGAGYSPFSKDEYDDDRSIGTVMRKALNRVLEDQGVDGRFRAGGDPGCDQALATLAVSEAYGMTAAPKFKEPVERALQALVRMQQPDGSWGGSEPTSWAIEALISAQMSEIPCPKSARDQALGFIDSAPHPANAFSRLYLSQDRASAAPEAVALSCSPPQGEGNDFNDWQHAALSLFHVDGPEGKTWQRMKEMLQGVIVPVQFEDGSWPGGTVSQSVVRTSLAELALELCLGYATPAATGK